MKTVSDKIIRRLRLRAAKPFISDGTVVLDIGCDTEMLFLREIARKIKNGVGIDQQEPDPTITRSLPSNISFRRVNVDQGLPFPDSTFDIVTMLAVLEHFSNPLKAVVEAKRVLKPGGRLVITTPSPASQRILEFMAFKLKLIDGDSIGEHKMYFDEISLKRLLEKEAGMRVTTLHKFEFGFNQIVTAEK